jgi:probable rRNA maturation factor
MAARRKPAIGLKQEGAIVIRLAEPRWRGEIAVVRSLCRRAARSALAAAGRGLCGEITIMLADDATLHALNREFRRKDRPTNVLAFPAAGPGPAPQGDQPLGDVVIAFETVAGEARAQGKPLSHHLAHLVVHGILHLLGYIHDRKADARRMEAVEIAALAAIGVPDPYDDGMILPARRRPG